VQARRSQPPLDTGVGERMTAEQAALLRHLSRDTYELEAFSIQLTQMEAAKRVAMLKAKLILQGETPHTP
jgi:transcriptional regulator of aromatic amino acid metabolism